MKKPVRILVVEDSLTVRKHMVDVLSGDPSFEVVGEAADGKTAIELCQSLKPDAISMDMMLPVMTGVAATEYIMAYCPTPILIVSASTNRGELFRTYDALAAGAVDVLEKPDGQEPDNVWEEDYLRALRTVSRIRVITHPRARLGRAGQRATSGKLPVLSDECRVVAIGASTGGPGAVQAILHSLPEGFCVPILLVLHISEPFGAAMAQWLNAQLPFEVRYAKDGEQLPARGLGCVLMAPPARHLEVSGGRLRLTDAPPRHSCIPSVDVLFESLAREMGSSAVGCLLTGMGKDGAKGLLAMKEVGAMTLAQDQATSVVFGMPAEAIRLGAATHVLALADFGPAIVRAAKQTTPEETR